eukprot:9428117-Karenia_brevis.AAC.1
MAALAALDVLAVLAGLASFATVSACEVLSPCPGRLGRSGGLRHRERLLNTVALVVLCALAGHG